MLSTEPPPRPTPRILSATCLFLSFFLSLTPHVHAQVPTPSTFIRRNNHGSVALGSFVYIDGGLYSQYDNDSTTTVWGPNTNAATLAIDMRTSWTNATAPITSIPKGNSPVYFQPQFWPDESANAFYSWSGSTPAGQAVAQKSIWKFSADGDGGGSWALHSSSSSSPSSSSDTDAVAFSSLTRPVGGYSAVLNGAGYYIGGYANGDSDDVNFSGSDMVPVPGVVSFNFSTGAWANGSSEGWTQYGTGMRGKAALVSFGGEAGLLILLGGESGSRTALSNQRGYLDFSSVAIYDPSVEGGAWYSQVTTGEAPSPRDEFCMAAAQGENSTELFVFGGWTVSTGVTHNDSYILSLPAFRWFKGSANTSPRVGLTCHPVGSGRQVLVVGGQDNNNNSFRWENPDPWKQGLGVFDMTAMEWSDGYDADAAAYESPQVVKKWYGNEENAEPEWSSDTVKALFSKTTTTTSSASPSGDGTVISGASGSSSASTKPSSKPNTGAIAGGVVGGVAALALVGFILFWSLRRRQRANHSPATTIMQELDIGSTKAELDGNSVVAELPTKMHQWAELPGSGPESRNHETTELPGIAVRKSQLK